MTIFDVSWGSGDPAGGRAEVRTVQELDALLDRIENLRSEGGLPFVVTVTRRRSDGEGLPYGLQVGVGHPHRARLLYFGPPAGGIGYDADLAPWPDGDISWEFGGIPSEDDASSTRVTPAEAREAARQYVATGRRPTVVRWES